MAFGVVVSEIDSLIFLSIVTLLVSKKANYFCALILYPATLLNCCISSSRLGVESFGFSI